MKDGMIDDWDLFENVLNYAYSQCIKSDPELHPVLMSEAPVSSAVGYGRAGYSVTSSSGSSEHPVA